MNSRQKGLARLSGLGSDTAQAGRVMEFERARFQRLANPESAPRVVSSFNLFQTPPELADRLVRLIPEGGRMLEPSAGLGRLYRAWRFVHSSPVVLVEQSPECAGELFCVIEGDSAATLIQADFLTLGVDRLGLFDCVVMNPPFKMGTDIKHIQHARQFVKPGGVLVSLCAAGPRQRAALLPICSEWIDLPAGSFKSEGTRVESAIVIFR